MATVAITHVIKNHANQVLPGIHVTARISDSAFRADDSKIADVQSYVSDSAGLVTMNLEQNSTVIPVDPAVVAADTYYTVDVLLPAKYGGPERHTIRATAAQSLQNSLAVV